MTEVTSPAPDGHRALTSPAISFEFFPPKTEEMERSLWETINRLAPLTPNFVSVTYGAGGSTRERTHSTITRILNETDLLPAAHLTCVGAARGEIKSARLVAPDNSCRLRSGSCQRHGETCRPREITAARDR